MSKVTQELLTHIKNENAKIEAWVAEDPKNRWSGTYITDVEYWEERKVFTVADLERDELINYIYDGHKDAYGFRNRGYDFDSMSMDELKAEADRISDAVEAENKRMDEYYANNKAELEKRIEDTMKNLGASDRQTAIRWILGAEDLITEYDVGYVQYSLGVPYDHMKEEFQQAMKGAA